MQQMTRDGLIELGKRIIRCEDTEQELDDLMKLFDQHVPHPLGSNLFFYPENHHAREDGISDYKPSVEEVVDQCLSYSAIQL